MNAEIIKNKLEMLERYDVHEVVDGVELHTLCTLALAGVKAMDWYYGKTEDRELERDLRELVYAHAALAAQQRSEA